MVDLTPFFNAIITILSIIMTAYLIPCLKQHFSAQKLQKFQDCVTVLVAAAEQTYLVTEGARKKEYVVARLQEMGYSVDPQQIDDAIEAAVLKLHHALYEGKTE